MAGNRKRTDSYNFLSIAKKEAIEGNEQDVQRLLASCPEDSKETFDKYLQGFKSLFAQFVQEDKGVQWEDISPPPQEMIKPHKELREVPEAEISKLLDKLVVLKLNGGLGTSMGCTGPKSVITVRNEFTFLDMQVQQIAYLNNKYNVDIPLVLMNSFNTHDHEDTEKVLRKYTSINVRICTFKQSMYPRIYKESFRVVAHKIDVDDLPSWYPPGHGDMYRSFYNSGLCEQFLSEGKDFVFCSNIDNLGATVDMPILNFLIESSKSEKPCEFIMEVTNKTRADVKGGTLIKYEEKLRLLEMAQVPKENVEEFKSVNKFRIFNTNNLWMKLSAIKRLVSNNAIHMEIIPNHKVLDNGRKIIQIETAIGAAIKCFDHSVGINVSRRRFLPVKSCSDLMLIMSNLYNMEYGTLSMSPRRQFQSTPIVNLGTSFKKVKDYLSRFETIPDIMELDHLTVSGDVTFGSNVTLKGTVIIIANHGERIDIPSGSILENKIVSGNLRILNH